MGFSFLALALIQSGLPDGPSRRLLASPGYSLGFVIVILGRQELFTESTLTAVLPLARPARPGDLVRASEVLGDRALRKHLRHADFRRSPDVPRPLSESPFGQR